MRSACHILFTLFIMAECSFLHQSTFHEAEKFDLFHRFLIVRAGPSKESVHPTRLMNGPIITHDIGK